MKRFLEGKFRENTDEIDAFIGKGDCLESTEKNTIFNESIKKIYQIKENNK